MVSNKIIIIFLNQNWNDYLILCDKIEQSKSEFCSRGIGHNNHHHLLLLSSSSSPFKWKWIWRRRDTLRGLIKCLNCCKLHKLHSQSWRAFVAWSSISSFIYCCWWYLEHDLFKCHLNSSTDYIGLPFFINVFFHYYSNAINYGVLDNIKWA